MQIIEQFPNHVAYLLNISKQDELLSYARQNSKYPRINNFMGHSVVFTFTCRYQNQSEQTGAEGGSQGASVPGLLPPPEHLHAAVEVGDQVPVHDLATGAAIVT